MATPAKPRARNWRPKFLDALGKLGNVRAAAELAGVNRATAYRARNADGKTGEKFRAAWNEAIDEACERLEQEALRRAVTGWSEPVFGVVTDDRGKRVKAQIGTVTRFSDRLLEVLLKAHKPEKYSERYRMEHSGPGGQPMPFRCSPLPGSINRR